jgi:hypothetical protein
MVMRGSHHVEGPGFEPIFNPFVPRRISECAVVTRWRYSDIDVLYNLPKLNIRRHLQSARYYRVRNMQTWNARTALYEKSVYRRSLLAHVCRARHTHFTMLPSGHLQAGDHEEPGEVSSMQTSLHRQNARRRVRRCCWRGQRVGLERHAGAGAGHLVEYS